MFHKRFTNFTQNVEHSKEKSTTKNCVYDIQCNFNKKYEGESSWSLIIKIEHKQIHNFKISLTWPNL